MERVGNETIKFFRVGELKLAQRQISMVELSAIIDSIDKNGDGKLTYEEVKTVLKQVGGKVYYSCILIA